MQSEPWFPPAYRMPDKATVRAMSTRYLTTQCSSSYDITHGGQSVASVTVAANMLIHDMLHEVNGRTYAPSPAVADAAARDVVLGNQKSVVKQRYEWIGDKYLALFIGELLSEAFPPCNGEAPMPTGLLHLAHGELQSNLLFSLLAVKHGMARAPFLKSSANTFEAYVHILRIDVNSGALQPWLRGIFEPLIRFFVKNYVLRIRTFEEFQAARYPARIQLRAGVAPDARGRYWRGVLSGWAAKAPSQTLVAAAAPVIPEPLATSIKAPLRGTAERRKVDGRITAVMGASVEVHLHKLHLPKQPRVWLRRCSEFIEDYKLDEEQKCITVTWKPTPGHNLEAEGFEIEDEEDEEDITIESHSSSLKEGTMIQVWIPFEGSQHDLSRSLVVAHPWDDRTKIVTDE